MRPSLAWAVAGGSLLVGLAAGYLVGKNQGPTTPTSSTSTNTATAKEHTDDAHRTGSGAWDDTAARDPATRSKSSLSERQHPFDEPDGAGPDGAEPNPTATSEPSEIEAAEPERELERVRRELAELQAERIELMGSPIDTPADVPSRFSGSSMSAAVGAALTAENVGGGVEGTDCAEHPCIVFGRLEGDEEDMEEIERSAALSPYADDVLTLLFWATSVDRAKTPTLKAPETGLFALAFYSIEDRATRGEELDRRIRARVMEFWNTDRPGPQ